MVAAYGNLMNRISESARTEPTVGEGATVTHYSDRDACTVTSVKDGIAIVQEDKATRTDSNGMSDSQDYAYERDPEGRTWTFRKDKTGRWSEVRFNRTTRRWNKVEGGCGVYFGRRDKHYDFGF